jgi:Na+-driven multidrug efflux pump
MLFGIVTGNKEIIALGGTILLIDIIVEAGRSVNLTMVRSLQAAGDIRFPILLGIASTWAVAVGMSYILGVRLEMGLVGVWTAMGADECLRAVICLFRWKGGRWKNKKLI